MNLALVTSRTGMRTLRFSGWVSLALLAAVAAVVCLRLAGSAAEIAEHMPTLLRGLHLTLVITLTSTVAGFLLAFPVAAARLHGGALLERICRGYCILFRGTPLLVQLYLVYYGSGDLSGPLRSAGLWWLFQEPLNCVFIVFILNTAAYQSEVIYGAVRALPQAQEHAALALGLGRYRTYRHVLLPQAMRLALRPLGNEWCKMLKASSIASIISVLDLLGSAKLIYADTLRFDFFLLIAVVYIVMVELISRLVNVWDAHLSRGVRNGRPARA